MQLYEKHISQNGKVSYTPYDMKPVVNPDAVMTDHQKTMYLTIALAAMETVKSNEKKNCERWLKVNNRIEQLAALITLYQPKQWTLAMISKAGMIVDAFDAKIQEEFGR